MKANADRDGPWAVTALKSSADFGSWSQSMNCRIEARDGDVIMNNDFAKLLAAWCIATNERLYRANLLLRQRGVEEQ